jgi:hypothetical protein
MGTMWTFCEKCKETTPHKIAFDDHYCESYCEQLQYDDEPYYRCEVCAGNITIEFARGFKEYIERGHEKVNGKDYKIGEGQKSDAH